MTLTDVERFATKFKTGENCWGWTEGKNSHGYGGFYAEGPTGFVWYVEKMIIIEVS